MSLLSVWKWVTQGVLCNFSNACMHLTLAVLSL